MSHLLGDVAIAGLAEASKAMKQSAMDKFTELTIPQIILGETEKPIFETVNLQQEVVLEILQKSATSSAVERLRKNPALAAWVEGGRELHAHSEDGKCEYCLQIIPEEREAELAAHFNASDAKLKREIERAIGDNKAAYEKVARMSGLSEKALYPEFRTDFLIYSGLLSEEQTKILNHLEALRKALEDKLAKRTESYNADFPSLVRLHNLGTKLEMEGGSSRARRSPSGTVCLEFAQPLELARFAPLQCPSHMLH